MFYLLLPSKKYCCDNVTNSSVQLFLPFVNKFYNLHRETGSFWIFIVWRRWKTDVHNSWSSYNTLISLLFSKFTSTLKTSNYSNFIFVISHISIHYLGDQQTFPDDVKVLIHRNVRDITVNDLQHHVRSISVINTHCHIYIFIYMATSISNCINTPIIPTYKASLYNKMQ